MRHFEKSKMANTPKLMFVVIDHRQHDDIMVLHLYTIIYFYNNMHSLNNMK